MPPTSERQSAKATREMLQTADSARLTIAPTAQAD
jgi:hypothetical protein